MSHNEQVYNMDGENLSFTSNVFFNDLQILYKGHSVLLPAARKYTTLSYAFLQCHKMYDLKEFAKLCCAGGEVYRQNRRNCDLLVSN